MIYGNFCWGCSPVTVMIYDIQFTIPKSTSCFDGWPAGKTPKKHEAGFPCFLGFPADLPEILKPKHPNRICVSSENRVYMANSIAYHHFPHFKEPELGAESPFSRFQAPQSFIILLAISHHIVDSEEESKLKRPRGFNRNKPNKIYPIQFILISYLPFKPSLAIINHY